MESIFKAKYLELCRIKYHIGYILVFKQSDAIYPWYNTRHIILYYDSRFIKCIYGYDRLKFVDSYTSNASIILTVAWIIIIIVPSFLTVVVVSISGTLSVLPLLTDRNYIRTTSADGRNKLIEERSYATVTVMILTAKCIMANAPKAVFFTFLFSNVHENIVRSDEKIHFELVFVLNMLVIISSFLNPVVYCVRLRGVRLRGARLNGFRLRGVRLNFKRTRG